MRGSETRIKLSKNNPFTTRSLIKADEEVVNLEDEFDQITLTSGDLKNIRNIECENAEVSHNCVKKVLTTAPNVESRRKLIYIGKRKTFT